MALHRRHRTFRIFVALSSAAAPLSFAAAASASNITEVGEGGSEQMQRGGAWVARASDPIAAYYNPAGLAGQDTGVSVSLNLITHHTCFTRVLAAGDSTQELAADPNTALFPRVCNDISPFPNPQLAFNYKVNDRIGVAVAVLGPNASGSSNWPEFVNNGAPAPQRYLLLKSEGTQLNPTIAIGVEVIDGLRIGGSFQWGIARFKLTNASAALNTDGASSQANDVKSLLQIRDMFIPGFTLGAIYSPIDELDLAGWYKYSAPIDATGDIVADSNYFTRQVAAGNTSGTKGTDTSYSDCGYGAAGDVCGGGKNGHLKVKIPMEAKLGIRYHKSRAATVDGDGNPVRSRARDPLANEKWDVELDLTWTNNSAFDALTIRFPGDAQGNGVIPLNGIAGGTVPPNADVKTGYKDVFGARLGGDYVILPDQLAVRAGVFGETSGQDQQYQNTDFAGAARFGFGFGGTYRLRFGDRGAPAPAEGEPAGTRPRGGKGSALEFSLGYGHIFFGVQDQGAQNRYAAGLPALAGVACNPVGASQPGDMCANGGQKYRTNWPINLGTIWNSVNTVNVGVAYRF
jgi:long-subunit fatty acid transport protein